MTATRDQRRRKREREKAAKVRIPSPEERAYLAALMARLADDHGRGALRWAKACAIWRRE